MKNGMTGLLSKFAKPGAIAMASASLMLLASTAHADGVATKLLGNPLPPSATALSNAKPFKLPRPTAAQLKAAGILNADGSVSREAAKKTASPASASAKGALKANAGSPAQDSVQVIPNSTAPATADGPVAPMAFGDGDWPFTTSRVELTGKMTNSKIYPYRAAGKLFITLATGETGWCSASLVARGVLVTAAHCVSEFGLGFYNAQWSFAPGYFNGKSAQKPVQAVYIVAPSGYVSGTDTCAVTGIICPNDVAVIVLANQRGRYVGSKTGWYGVGYDGYGFNSSNDTQVTQLGYPSGIDYGNQMIRNDSAGIVSASDSNNTITGSQMNQGASGGPWLNNFGMPGYANGVGIPYAAQPNTVVGVTSWGYTDGITDIMGASPFTSGNIIALLNNACSLYPDACAP